MTSHDDPSFRDGWGPGAFDADDWRAGDREGWGGCNHGQHEQRREQADDNRPNLLSWASFKRTAFWIVMAIGTAVVGFVFGQMIVRAFF